MKFIITLFLVFVMAACSSGVSDVQKASDTAVDDVGCKNIKSKMFDVILTGVDSRAEIINPEDLRAIIQKRFDEKWSSTLTESERNQLQDKMMSFYEELYETLKNENSLSSLQKELAKLEIGIVEDAKYPEKNEVLQKKSDELLQLSENYNLACDDDTTSPKEALTLSYGSAYTFATAYQSCEVLDKAPMNSSTPSLKGIVITGTHNSGGGNKREIRDLAAVQKSHHYLQNIQYGKTCVDVSLSPLIYDFGGKPYATSRDPNTLDFFMDAGTGTKVLGTDCSGFVFTALGAAGLKISSTVDMKPSLVTGVGASEYMNPSANKMNCFEYPTFGFKNGTIEEGDIVSIKGHVFLIDQTSSDPFGFLKLKNINECKNLTYKNFDFVVAQSSPTKGAMGISKSLAIDYVSESSTIKNGLEYYARQTCELHFKKSDRVIDYTNLRIVRHKGTDECRMKPFALKHEECIQSCMRQ